MPWKKTANVAMYKGADWSGLVAQVPDCSPESAQRIALKNPDISFFFYCREPMYLEPTDGNPGRQFNPGDAVFFSGEPWFGSAPQCDSYEKAGINTVYIDPSSSSEFCQAACYKLADGSRAIDVVCIFAGNYSSDHLPYLRANNNNPPTNNPFNSNIQQVLDDGSVQYLQRQGITVLLTITNGHSQVGWSEFTNQTDATNFASYLQTLINQYQLDGIDIDDEYSNGTPVSDSLAMVTTIMRQKMPDILITKALFDDLQYFGVSWNGTTLENNLNYGWQMSYGSSPEWVLPDYVNAGMNPNQLSMGFWSNQAPQNPQQNVQWLVQNGYAGMMMYAFETQTNIDMMGQLVNYWYNSTNNWNLDPDCGNN